MDWCLLRAARKLSRTRHPSLFNEAFSERDAGTRNPSFSHGVMLGVPITAPNLPRRAFQKPRFCIAVGITKRKQVKTGAMPLLSFFVSDNILQGDREGLWFDVYTLSIPPSWRSALSTLNGRSADIFIVCSSSVRKLLSWRLLTRRALESDELSWLSAALRPSHDEPLCDPNDHAPSHAFRPRPNERPPLCLHRDV